VIFPLVYGRYDSAKKAKYIKDHPLEDVIS